MPRRIRKASSGEQPVATKSVTGFPGYKVCADGSVISYRRYKAGQVLKQIPNDRGQRYVALYKDDGSRNLLLASRLVAKAFISNPGRLPNVVHKNSDRADNRAANLVWADSKETHTIPFNNGKYKHYKINEKAGAEIVSLRKQGIPVNELARRFKVNRITIRYWLLGKTYKRREQVTTAAFTDSKPPQGPPER